MSTKQVKIPSQSADSREIGDTPAEMRPEPAVKNPRQDLAFAVKLFGISGLVIFLIWLMNRAVS